MKNLFVDVFQRAQAENKPVGLRTDRENPKGMYVGYVEEFTERIIQLKAITKQGLEDGVTVVKLKDVFGVEFNDRYLKRVDLLYKSDHKLDLTKERDSAEPDSADEDFMVKLLKRLKKHKVFVTVNFEFDLSIGGYITAVNEAYFQVNVITDEGEEDGLSTYKVEDIQRVFGDGIDERKTEFFYQNRNKLNQES